MPASAKSASTALDRTLTLELVRVTERSAVAAAAWRGRGDEIEADLAAVAAMHEELDRLPVRGRIVVGEGEKGEADSLFVGQKVGAGKGPPVDVALDPLEGKTICAKDLPNSISVVALAERDALLRVPDIYMEKLAVGPGFPDGILDLDAEPAETIGRVGEAKGVRPSEVSVCILDRPRHGRLIEAVRETGASIRLIGDGDVAGIIHTTEPEVTGVDIYMGSGGAGEGILAAAALRCIGGQMLGRLIADSPEKRKRAAAVGIKKPESVMTAENMASGDILFAATGITDGNLLDGVRVRDGAVMTHSLVTRSRFGTQRWVRTRHRLADKIDAGK